jgi:hypothetical protein
MLRSGGLYPIVVPLGWKLVGPEGDVELPVLPGAPHHRIVTQQAVLATEATPSERPEAMMVRQHALAGPITRSVLKRYVDLVMEALTESGWEPRLDGTRIGICALSAEPCGRVVVNRMAPADGRMDLRYLVRDQTGAHWELTYLVRRENVDRWRPLLAEIEGPLFASTAAN